MQISIFTETKYSRLSRKYLYLIKIIRITWKTYRKPIEMAGKNQEIFPSVSKSISKLEY